jgi:ketosteroid isomerase-like protein
MGRGMRLLSFCSLAGLLSQLTPSQPAIASSYSARLIVAAKFDAVNRHAISEIVALYADDATVTASDFCQPRVGRAEVERTYRAIFAAIRDAKVTIRDYLVDGDKVAVRFILESTIPGHAFKVPISDFFTVRNGLIVADDGYFDNRGRACTP